VYIVSLSAGQLYLGGRIVVKRIVSRPEAVRLWNNDNLYDAEEWIVDSEESGMLLHLYRRLSPALANQLRFKSKSGSRKPAFVSDRELNNQATRGVRELTPESAALLDRIIEITDRLPRSDQLLTVTEKLLRNGEIQERTENVKLTEELLGEDPTQSQAASGFGNPAENKQVEEAAISIVRKHYENDGWDVRSVERDKCGFDLECRKSKAIENVEVKGVSGAEQSFIMTAGEVKQAKSNCNFALVVVTLALSASPVLKRYSGPEFCQYFELSSVQYRAVLRK
jgi:hypothetical protein